MLNVSCRELSRYRRWKLLDFYRGAVTAEAIHEECVLFWMSKPNDAQKHLEARSTHLEFRIN
jgi:hypothetical protein